MYHICNEYFLYVQHLLVRHIQEVRQYREALFRCVFKRKIKINKKIKRESAHTYCMYKCKVVDLSIPTFLGHQFVVFLASSAILFYYLGYWVLQVMAPQGPWNTHPYAHAHTRYGTIKLLAAHCIAVSESHADINEYMTTPSLPSLIYAFLSHLHYYHLWLSSVLFPGFSVNPHK